MNEDIGKTHIKFSKATLVKEDQEITRATKHFGLQGFSKDYMGINQVV